MTNFLETGDSRETSREIMDAILFIAAGDERAAERIWDAPDDRELLAIWGRVTQNGLIAADDYCWGWSGNQWARDIAAHREQIRAMDAACAGQWTENR